VGRVGAWALSNAQSVSGSAGHSMAINLECLRDLCTQRSRRVGAQAACAAASSAPW
jgi:hypothetical protein